MAKNNYNLEGVDLTNPSLGWIANRVGTSIRSLPSKTVNSSSVPGNNGYVFPANGRNLDDTAFTVRIRVYGANRQQMMQRYEKLLGLLTISHRLLKMVDTYTVTGEPLGPANFRRRWTWVEVIASSEPTIVKATDLDIDVIFNVPGAVWYQDDTPTTVSGAWGASGLIDLTPTLTDCNTRIEDYTLQLRGPLDASFRITDLSSGDYIQRISGAAIDANTYVYFNPETWVIIESTSATMPPASLQSVTNQYDIRRSFGNMLPITPKFNTSLTVSTYQFQVSPAPTATGTKWTIILNRTFI